MAWTKGEPLTYERTTSLKIKPRLVVKNQHTELLLLSESLETKAAIGEDEFKTVKFEVIISENDAILDDNEAIIGEYKMTYDKDETITGDEDAIKMKRLLLMSVRPVLKVG